MNKSCTNIYKNARECADLTQEQAADELHISVRLLSSYENGKTPSEDVIENMIKVYDSLWLAYQHLKLNTKIGQKYLPEIDFTSLAELVLKLQKEVSDLEDMKKKMVEIACDGVIDKHEEVEWRGIKKEIWDVASVTLSLMFMKGSSLNVG